MIKQRISIIYAVWLLVFCIHNLCFNSAYAEFPTVKAKTFAGEKFIFPTDIKGSPLSLLFLAMAADRDNGQLQQQQLIEWHKALQQQGVLSAHITPYHFPVMKSPPFFVKGVIRNAMAEAYEGTADENLSGVLYVDNLQAFADSARLTLDDKPTLVLLSADGKLLAEIKGTLSEQRINALKDVIHPHLPTGD